LKLKARTVVEGILTGLHRSPHKGSSVEFAEHKEYTPGDDIRHIDWRLFGKSDKYYVKQFEDETNLKAYVLLDVSGSMGYASAGVTKGEYAAQIAAAVAYTLLRQSDAVGLMLFHRGAADYVPPRARSVHLTDLLLAVSRAELAGTTDLAAALERLSEVARRRSLVLLLSDVFDHRPEVMGRLRQHRARGHDVALFHVLDPAERHFPFEDQTLFVDMEDDALRVEANPKMIRAAYREEIEGYIAGMRRACEEADIEYNLVETSVPVEDVVARFVTRRARMVR
jgi:uncharacterized protein (DUF58 family)